MNKNTSASLVSTPAQHQTSKRILYMDRLAHAVITIGGIGTIVAVLMVFFFLVYIAWPLFAPVSTKLAQTLPTSVVQQSLSPSYVFVDEDRRLLCTLDQQGLLQVVDVASQEIISQQKVFAGVQSTVEPTAQLTALMMSTVHNIIIAGFADGSIQMARISFENSFISSADIETPYSHMKAGDIQRRKNGIVFKTPSQQWRYTQLHVLLEEPLDAGHDAAIERIDMCISTDGPVIATYDAQHQVSIHRIVEKRNLMTMTVSKRLQSQTIPHVYSEKNALPRDIILIGQGEYLLLLWADGYSERYNALEADAYLADKSRLADSGLEVSTVGRFLGRSTLLLGYSDGSVSAWFLTEPESAETKDGRVWQAGHRFSGNGAAVRSISSSQRQRLALCTYADNSARLLHVSSERVLYDGAGVEDPLCAGIAPKDDALILYGAQAINIIDIDAEHPDVTLASLFLPVWYESASSPETVWQSSSASDDAEAKLGLWPLIFGTLKATFYSLLFAVPIAFAAAIYSSEFLHAGTKKVVKPCIEMMASLPSVVLGFLGGLILSIWLKDYIVDVLTAIFVVPLTVSAAAYAIQLLPRKIMVQTMRYRLYIIAGPCVVLAYFITRVVAACAESLLFAGDFIAWLDGAGSSIGGTWYLCLPVSFVIVLFSMSRWGKPLLIEKMRGSSIARCAMVDLIKFICTTLAVMICALVIAVGIEGVGMKLRGSGQIFDVYETRNAMVVGCVMAFAIIPIIYTIADDALSAVPHHLRAASLGAGATPWQTAIRIVVPTAMSGLFSALMVGLGRAIGETMIVLMAAGNTPIKDVNIFNGLKTLSANIASELPEAVVGSTHYRTLFLSALVLFVMTFVLNTLAEYVRARFRKQVASL